MPEKSVQRVLIVSFVTALACPAVAQDKPEAPAPSKAAPLGTSGEPKTDHPSGAMSAKKGSAKHSMSQGHRHKH